MVLDAEQIDGWEHGTQVSGHPRGPWSQTASGAKYHPLDPAIENITLEDIAHQLSMVNRFSGATRFPYSVAQHSLLCAAVADHLFGGDVLLRKCVLPDMRRWALLHDAPEYVLGDMVRPVKVLLPEYSAMEDRLMAAIAARFGLPQLRPAQVAALKKIDNIACVIEKTHLLDNSAEWPGMPPYLPGFHRFVVERNWRDVRTDYTNALNAEFK